MKTLYLIGGTMGVGKTTVCQALKKQLSQSVFLDGDWCWDMSPFQVNEETKKMVIDNICSLLNNFIQCSCLENIIFCWVMHEQSIIDDILSRLNTSNCKVKCYSLTVSQEMLKKRLQNDIENKIRKEDVIERSIARLEMYQQLDTIKIDTSLMSVDEIVEMIENEI